MKGIDTRKDAPKQTRKKLTVQERIALLKETKKILGPKGRNWVKGKWYSHKAASPGGYTWGTNPDSATGWCLLGAMEEAAYRLGFSATRDKNDRFGEMTSVQKLAVEKTGYQIMDLNDRGDTSWDDINTLINERLKQLQKGAK